MVTFLKVLVGVVVLVGTMRFLGSSVPDSMATICWMVESILLMAASRMSLRLVSSNSLSRFFAFILLPHSSRGSSAYDPVRIVTIVVVICQDKGEMWMFC